MKPIPFFTTNIAITVHSATKVEHCGKTVTLQEFSEGRPISLAQADNGDLYACYGSYPNITFIEGAEASC